MSRKTARLLLRAGSAIVLALSAADCTRNPNKPAAESTSVAPGGTIRETTTTHRMDSPQRAVPEPRRVVGEGLEHALTREQALRDLYTDIPTTVAISKPLVTLGDRLAVRAYASQPQLSQAVPVTFASSRIASRIQLLRTAGRGGPAIAGISGGRGGPPAPKWRNIGPTNVAGRVASIAVDGRGTVYRGSAGGGVWRADVAGTWTPLTDNLGSLSIGAIAVSTTNPSVIYIGTGEGSIAIDGIDGIGIVKSTDGGGSWQLHNQSGPDDRIPTRSFDLSIRPGNDEEVLAATELGVLKTADGGKTWKIVMSDGLLCTQLARSGVNPNMVVAAMWEWYGHGSLYASTDGGDTWKKVGGAGMAPFTADTGRLSIARSARTPGLIYALAGAASRNATGCGEHDPYALDQVGIYKSIDGGQNWTFDSNPYSGDCQGGFDAILTQGWYANAITIDPKDDGIVYAGGLNLWRKDPTNRWQRLTNWADGMDESDYVHADLHAFAWSGNELLIASDGGLHRMTPGATVKFERLDTNCPTRQYYSIGISAGDANLIVGGAQDNGTNIRVAGGGDFREVVGGDGFGVAVHPSSPNTIYATMYGTQVFKSTDGKVFDDVSPPYKAERAPFITPLAMDPSDPEMLFTGTNYLWKTSNGAQNWTRIEHDFAPSPERGYITAIATDDRGTHLAVGTAAGTVSRSDDAGATWTVVGRFKQAVMGLTFDPADAQVVFVGLGGVSAPHLVKIAGSAAVAPLAMGLPDAFPVHVIRVDPLNAMTMYAGTDVGLYVSGDKGAHWTLVGLDRGLPPVSVWDMAITPDGGRIRIATHGRGFFELDRSNATTLTKPQESLAPK
jgi:photosystem II stability/assembly factor-like uncharacterized protein